MTPFRTIYGCKGGSGFGFAYCVRLGFRFVVIVMLYRLAWPLHWLAGTFRALRLCLHYHCLPRLAARIAPAMPTLLTSARAPSTAGESPRVRAILRVTRACLERNRSFPRANRGDRHCGHREQLVADRPRLRIVSALLAGISMERLLAYCCYIPSGPHRRRILCASRYSSWQVGSAVRGFSRRTTAGSRRLPIGACSHTVPFIAKTPACAAISSLFLRLYVASGQCPGYWKRMRGKPLSD